MGITKLSFVAGLFAFAVTAKANLIVNGGFETPVLSAGQIMAISPGANIGGWTALGATASVSLMQGQYSEIPLGMTAFNAQEGLSSLDVTGLGNVGPTAGVSQTVATTAGQVYQLTFFVGQAFSSNGSSAYLAAASVDLKINGGAAQTFINATNSPLGLINWKLMNVQFTAASASTTIAFMNSTTLSSEAGIDNVSLNAVVEAVPEPTGLALLGVGSLMLALRTRRHR